MGTMPFPGSMGVPTNIRKLAVKFSGNVSAGSLTTTNIKIKKVSDSLYISGSNYSVVSATSGAEFTSDMAVITLNVALSANSEYQLEISGVTDSNSAPVSSFTSPFTTGNSADTTGPSVVGRLPNIATGVPVNAIDVHVMTDDKLDPTSVSSSNVKLKQGSNEVPGAVDFDPFTGEIMFLADNAFQASTEYSVSVNATGTDPCVSNISGYCLQDTDGNANNKYEFTFTTGDADVQSPGIMFANADPRMMAVTFNEPINKNEATTLSNYVISLGSSTATPSEIAGQTVFYDAARRTVIIQNLNLPPGSAFTLYVSNIHDLSGNLIGAQNSAQGTIGAMGSGQMGPGSTSCSGSCSGGDMPTNFATSTFAFVPSAEAMPMSPLVGVQTTYFFGIPISQQIKNSADGGKIVLTFDSTFSVSGVTAGTEPMMSDINGPGSGTLTISSLTLDNVAKTITVKLSDDTRCGNANVYGCGNDTHDFIGFSLRGITNSPIPKDGSSGGYTVDIKTFNSNTVLESMTSKPFFLLAGASNAIQAVITAAGAGSGNAVIHFFSPMTGPQDATSTDFSGGTATATLSGLPAGFYDIFTDPIITLGATDYLGKMSPTNVQVTGTSSTSTVALTLQTTTGLATVTVRFSAPGGKNVDVFAGGPDRFVVKSTSTVTTTQDIQLKLSSGTWYVGVGPQMPIGKFNGPPPSPEFVMQPPAQVSISGVAVTESSGTANDGIVEFTLGAANNSLSGYVYDSSSRPIVGAEVFAYSPMGGFGTHGQTDTTGHFNLKIGNGVYQVGAFVPGMPSAPEMAVEVTNSGIIVNGVSGQTTLTFRLTKPERFISGKVLDQNNNPVQNAGVFAYCDPSVAGNACFGSGDHTGSPTGSDGSYTLYIKSGTWRIGAFLPEFGELPTVQKVVSTADFTNVNFYPSQATNFYTISGQICRDSNGSANVTCNDDSNDSEEGGVFVRAFSSSGANQSVTNENGDYTIKVPADDDYTIEAFAPSIGRLKTISSVDVSSGNVANKDFVMTRPRTVTVNIKDSLGNAVTVNEIFVDFYDATNTSGSNLRLLNATTGSITLPQGEYRVKASLPGSFISGSSISSDSDGTVVTGGILTVDGNEAIKITVPTIGTVTGTVYSGSADSGNELRDAMVNLSSKSIGVFLSTQANSSGVFSVKVPVGTYNVTAQKPGYFSIPSSITVTSTDPVTVNPIVTQATLTVSGFVLADSATPTAAFVKAEKTGGGFSVSQIDSSGSYGLPVTSGTWRIYAVAEGYAETEYTSQVDVGATSVTGKNFNLSSKVTLAAPVTCQITPSQGGQCSDTTGGVVVVVPPSALGSGTTNATLTIKKTNVRPSTSSIRPRGVGFDFKATDSTGAVISNFNSPVTLEFTQAKADLVATGFSTKTKLDSTKITLWSEAIKDYDILMTTVEYLNGSGVPVVSPEEDLSNISSVKFTALTSHFSGGGPGEGEENLTPAAPIGIIVTGSLSKIRIEWNAVTTNADGSSLSDLSGYRVWRSTSQSSGFVAITTTASTVVLYDDTSAVAGTTYYYKVTAYDTDDNQSNYSSTSNSVSRTSEGSSGGGGGAPSGSSNPPTPPTGGFVVSINNGVQTTNSRNVTLTLNGGSDARNMVVSNNADFVGAALETYVITKSWTLTEGYGAKTVYAKFYTSYGVASGVASDSIVFSAGQGEPTPPGQQSSQPGVGAGVSSGVSGQIVKRLVQGMKHAEVSILQEFFAKDKDVYPEGIVSGYFGALTKKAVQRFQEKYGIAKTGEPGYGDVGPKTKAKLNELLGSAVLEAPAVSPTPSGGLSQEQRTLIESQIQVLQEQLVKLLAELSVMLQTQTGQ